ncbi:MAG: 2Fe-2S iron-sulfur cluster-binding protein, partial [Pseudomonadota bacterium]
GLYLFVFTTCHLLTLSFGLHSLGSLESAHLLLMAPWRTQYGTATLGLAFVVHLLLGMLALYHRNTLSMRSGDSIQFLSAFLIVPLLLPHIVVMVTFEEIFGVQPTFPVMLDYFWNLVPTDGFKQVVIVIVVWIHGCIGLLTWLRLRDNWSRWAPFVNPLVVAIPILALLGFVEAGNQIIAMSRGTTRSLFTLPIYGPGLRMLVDVISTAMIAYFVLFGLTLLARAIRVYRVSRGSAVTLRFATGETATSKPGLNILEMANESGIPHPNQCRGRGRCGTCRVRVSGPVPLPPATELETDTLNRVAPGHAERNERLACQLEPTSGDYEVYTVLLADLSVIEPSDGVDPVDDALAETRSGAPSQ